MDSYKVLLIIRRSLFILRKFVGKTLETLNFTTNTNGTQKMKKRYAYNILRPPRRFTLNDRDKLNKMTSLQFRLFF